MKALALELLRSMESVVFWMVALPFAAIAFPVLAIVNAVDGSLRADFAALAKNLKARPA